MVINVFAKTKLILNFENLIRVYSINKFEQIIKNFHIIKKKIHFRKLIANFSIETYSEEQKDFRGLDFLE